MSAQHQPPTEAAEVSPRATETAGNGIEERVAGLLLAHRRCFLPDGAAFCSCNQWWYSEDTSGAGWHEHAASVLVAELGLTGEWCARHESGGGGIYTDHDDVRRFLDGFTERPPGVEDPGSGRYTGLERRYVTSWEPT